MPISHQPSGLRFTNNTNAWVAREVEAKLPIFPSDHSLKSAAVVLPQTIRQAL